MSAPTIGSRQGKIWGSTQPVFSYNGTEAHVIRVLSGGFCSCHKHTFKWNRFVIISGRMVVRIFEDNMRIGTHQKLLDTTTIGPGEVTDVPHGVRHEFEALEDCIALEFYWTELDPDDIDRCGSQGGIRVED